MVTVQLSNLSSVSFNKLNAFIIYLHMYSVHVGRRLSSQDVPLELPHKTLIISYRYIVCWICSPWVGLRVNCSKLVRTKTRRLCVHFIPQSNMRAYNAHVILLITNSILSGHVYLIMQPPTVQPLGLRNKQTNMNCSDQLYMFADISQDIQKST